MNFLMSLHALAEYWEAPFFVRIMDKIDPQHIIDGFEINGNPEDGYERHYMVTFATLMRQYHRRIQYHSHFTCQENYDNLNYLNKQLQFYHDLSLISGEALPLVLHAVDAESTTLAIQRTHCYLENLNHLKQLHNYNISFSLENLNASRKRKRLNTSDIQPLIESHSGIDFCWDIGHEVSEKNCNYALTPSLEKALKNVHIHDINRGDHYPFDYGKTNFKKAIDYLHHNHYTGSVVTEINIDYLPGDTLLERIRAYTQNVALLKNHYLTIAQPSEKVYLR